MSRILKRPMFRKGGPTPEGLISLVEPRRQYAESNYMDLMQTPEEILIASVPERTYEMPTLSDISAKDIASIFTGGETKQKTTGFEKSPEARPSLKPKVELTDAELGINENDNNDSDLEQQIKNITGSDLKTVYQDLLPLFEKELGIDGDETRRQKYMQLAQLGLGILAQPGGNLASVIGRAGMKPLEGLSKISDMERKEKRLPKELALQAALRETEPGSFQKGVKDLMKLGLSKQKALEVMTERGEATKTATYEGTVKSLQEKLAEEGTVLNSSNARGTAIDLLKAERLGVPTYSFTPFPEKGAPETGAYYIMKNGQSGRYFKGKLLKPGEKGFTGDLPL